MFMYNHVQKFRKTIWARQNRQDAHWRLIMSVPVKKHFSARVLLPTFAIPKCCSRLFGHNDTFAPQWGYHIVDVLFRQQFFLSQIVGQRSFSQWPSAKWLPLNSKKKKKEKKTKKKRSNRNDLKRMPRREKPLGLKTSHTTIFPKIDPESVFYLPGHLSYCRHHFFFSITNEETSILTLLNPHGWKLSILYRAIATDIGSWKKAECAAS